MSRGLGDVYKRQMLETLFCGNQVKMNNQVGTHHGEEEDLVGILNVVQCLKNVLILRLIFTVEVLI